MNRAVVVRVVKIDSEERQGVGPSGKQKIGGREPPNGKYSMLIKKRYFANISYSSTTRLNHLVGTALHSLRDGHNDRRVVDHICSCLGNNIAC